jgi:hypothetical protein
MHWIALVCLAMITLIWVSYLLSKHYSKDDLIGSAVFSILILTIGAGIWIGVYCSSRTFVEEFEAARVTVEKARAQPNVRKYELYGITEMLVENNQDLAYWKYYNQNWFMYSGITDQIDELQPLK